VVTSVVIYVRPGNPAS